MRSILTFTLVLPLLTGCFSSGGGGGGTTTSTPVSDSANETIDPANIGSDPLASYAWHLQNTAQSTFSSNGGVAGQDFNIKEVHDLGITGDGVKIAISDTGVDTGHIDLDANQLVSQHRDYSSDTSSTWADGGDPYPTEREGHGTNVAGLAAAVGWNGAGSRGVAPNAQFGAFLFVGDFHNSQSSYDAKTLHQMNGSFDIFNYSYGWPGCDYMPVDDDVITAYQFGVNNLRSGRGAIYIKSAGNDYASYRSECSSGASGYYLGNTNTQEDQNVPYVIITGAMNADGDISSYSTPGSGVWISSAGGEFGTSSPAMLTTDIRGCSYGTSKSSSSNAFNSGTNSLNFNCNYTNKMNGTSSAAPVLSGIVALMLEARPTLTWRDIKHILAMTAEKVNYSTGAMPHPGGSSMTPTGHVYDNLYVRNAANVDFSNTYGFGRVDADAAVAMASSYAVNLGTYQESSWFDSGTLALSIPDNSAAGRTRTMNVTSNLTIESVQIKLSVTHAQAGRLGVELTSPGGTTSKILLINSNIDQANFNDFMMISNAFYNENSNGVWTLKVIDGSAGTTGTLTGWKIKINGH